MKEIILHIGMHKTGTSSIQESFSSYDDGTTRYAQFGVSNHSIPITTIFSKDPHSYHIWKNQGLSRDLVEQRRTHYRAILDEHLGDESRHRLVISGEDICVLSQQEKSELIGYFLSRGMDLKVVCVTRNPGSVTSSLIQQFIKGGLASITKIALDYRSALKCFHDCLPRHKVMVRDFHALIDEHGDIVKAFSRLCGIDIAGWPIVRENESLSAAATKLVFRFNRLPVVSSGDGKRVSARQQLISALSTIFPNEGPSSTIDRSISDGLVSVKERDLAFLKRRYGISYEMVASSVSLERCEAYFSDLRDIDVPRLRSGLEMIGVSCRPEDTIDSLLVSLYYHFFHGTSLEESDAGYLRDIATKIARRDGLVMQDAALLMALANRARPDGTLVRQKPDEYGSPS